MKWSRGSGCLEAGKVLIKYCTIAEIKKLHLRALSTACTDFSEWEFGCTPAYVRFKHCLYMEIRPMCTCFNTCAECPQLASKYYERLGARESEIQCYGKITSKSQCIWCPRGKQVHIVTNLKHGLGRQKRNTIDTLKYRIHTASTRHWILLNNPFNVRWISLLWFSTGHKVSRNQWAWYEHT